MSSNPYCQNLATSSFVVRDGFVIITQFSGSKYVHEVKIPLAEFLKASKVIQSKEEA